MRKLFLALSSVVLLVAACDLTVQDASAKAKKWTVTQRQEALSKEINAGQKSGDLTAKEADALKEQAAKIEAKIVKMKAKNDGKLSFDNENTLEKDLNKLSMRIQKLKLEKRVQK